MSATASIRPNPPQTTGWYINSKWCHVGVLRCQVLCMLLEIFSSTAAIWNSTNVAAMVLVVPSMLMVMFYNQVSGWWQLNYFLCSTRNLGKMNPFWRAYFSDGLVQPPTRGVFSPVTVCFFFKFSVLGLEEWSSFVPHPVCCLFCLLGMLDSYLKAMPYVLYPG